MGLALEIFHHAGQFRIRHTDAVLGRNLGALPLVLVRSVDLDSIPFLLGELYSILT
jgi:hypothetical protein